MKYHDKVTGNRKNIASDDDVPLEKWLVCYRNPASKKHPSGSVFIRQFYAAGFYEAYDTVLTYAENMNVEVMWFREKHSCKPFLNYDVPELETLATSVTRSSMTSRQCPAGMRAARPSFAQGSAW